MVNLLTIQSHTFTGTYGDAKFKFKCLAAIATVEKAGYSALNSKPTQEPPYFAALIRATVNTPSPIPKASKDATCLVWKPSERFGIIHPHIGYNNGFIWNLVSNVFCIRDYLYIQHIQVAVSNFEVQEGHSLAILAKGPSPSIHPEIQTEKLRPLDYHGLVVSTHLKNISQNGNLPQIGVKIENTWNHHLESRCDSSLSILPEQCHVWSLLLINCVMTKNWQLARYIC